MYRPRHRSSALKTNRCYQYIIALLLTLCAYQSSYASLEAVSSMPQRGMWPKEFTFLIRSSLPNYWGNWSLDTSIVPGAVGYIDTSTGQFIRTSIMPNITSTKTDLSSSLRLSTKHVSYSLSQTNLSAKIPVSTSGATTSTPGIGLKAKWEFTKEGSMTAAWVLDSQENVDLAIDAIQTNLPWLQSQAEAVSMYSTDTGIAQSFGMVTGVTWAKSGMNAGSHSDKASLSFSGKVDDIENMLGINAAQANTGAAFSMMDSSGALSTYSWPANSNTKTNTMIPIAYSFASLSGDTIIPNWIGTVNSFSILLDNTKSSYIVEATLQYSVDDKDSEESANSSQKISITGGSSNAFSDIPLNAHSLKLNVQFVQAIHNASYSFHWERPLGHWLTGKRHIMLHGVWPGHTSCYVEEESFAQ